LATLAPEIILDSTCDWMMTTHLVPAAVTHAGVVIINRVIDGLRANVSHLGTEL
jgi:hypothetical protein